MLELPGATDPSAAAEALAPPPEAPCGDDGCCPPGEHGHAHAHAHAHDDHQAHTHDGSGCGHAHAHGEACGAAPSGSGSENGSEEEGEEEEEGSEEEGEGPLAAIARALSPAARLDACVTVVTPAALAAGLCGLPLPGGGGGGGQEGRHTAEALLDQVRTLS